MSFVETYPHLNQWATYGGTIGISTKGDMSAPSLSVEVAVGDAGGVPEGCRISAATVDDALAGAEERVRVWLLETHKLLNDLVSGALLDTENEFVMVAGWPPVKNPHFRRADV